MLSLFDLRLDHILELRLFLRSLSLLTVLFLGLLLLLGLLVFYIFSLLKGLFLLFDFSFSHNSLFLLFLFFFESGDFFLLLFFLFEFIKSSGELLVIFFIKLFFSHGFHSENLHHDLLMILLDDLENVVKVFVLFHVGLHGAGENFGRVSVKLVKALFLQNGKFLFLQNHGVEGLLDLGALHRVALETVVLGFFDGT